MEIVDSFAIDEKSFLCTVSLEEGFTVDVKVNAESGLVFVMQNEDGSTVYSQVNSEYTFPDYEYDENAVTQFIKKTCGVMNIKKDKPTLDDMLADAASKIKKQARDAMDDLNKQISFSEQVR